MDDAVRRNRAAWETAAGKYVREHDDLLREAREGTSLHPPEIELLRPLLLAAPVVVHLQSGHGLDDVALVAAGARTVIGVDYSAVTTGAAHRRAAALGLACRYVVAELPGAPLSDGCAELVYTGKGALIWMRDLAAWARDVARLLRPAGHLFVYEAHPAAALWSWDADEPRIRADRSYFGDCFVNDTFPGNGAVEFQWTLGEIVNVVLAAGLELLHLAEHPEPFWRPGGITAAAWSGRLPNAFSLLARRPPEPAD
ncbi:class I SAM-dependent methyltransferase [Micromonospora carbonacea]|uniref:class I SAM-dependent methyltransferase n=1 Tax=Micromonospora carbonacea TaxID=47853 RepID=UPI00371C5095